MKMQLTMIQQQLSNLTMSLIHQSAPMLVVMIFQQIWDVYGVMALLQCGDSWWNCEEGVQVADYIVVFELNLVLVVHRM